MHSNGGIKDDLANFILRHNFAPLRLCGKEFLSDWQRERKRATFANFTLYPDPPAM
jgi:hypothetical protein